VRHPGLAVNPEGVQAGVAVLVHRRDQPVMLGISGHAVDFARELQALENFPRGVELDDRALGGGGPWRATSRRDTVLERDEQSVPDPGHIVGFAQSETGAPQDRMGDQSVTRRIGPRRRGHTRTGRRRHDSGSEQDDDDPARHCSGAVA